MFQSASEKKSKHQFSGGENQTPAAQGTALVGGPSDSILGLAAVALG